MRCIIVQSFKYWYEGVGWEVGQLIKLTFVIIALGLALWAAAHAILRRRDPRAALWWVAITLAMPVFGAVLYYLFGINRIHRRKFNQDRHPIDFTFPVSGTILPTHPHLDLLAGLVGRITAVPLFWNNRVSLLKTGDEAYRAMLQAINQAEKTIGLDIYIFNDDHAGRLFVGALADAVRRGVKVGVLIDEVGSRYSGTSVYKALKAAGVPAAYFMPSLSPWRLRYLNLRNHRKILITDGKLGFTGGMNIHGNHLMNQGMRTTQDLHFKVEGPVVAQMQEAFRDDWFFATGEILEGPGWFPNIPKVGSTIVRGISDGPDRDVEKGRWSILGGMDIAQKSIQIVTPYFVPDNMLIAQLGLAALKGVRVDIVLPKLSDLPFVNWASRATLWQVLERGCHVWFSPPPFDHTKLMVVDRAWSFIGSSNWDTRSLRLNFEFNMECYDQDLAGDLADMVHEKMAISQEVSLDEMDARKFPIKLRDGVARLFAPHL